MEQTRRLYYEDATTRSFCAVVLACEPQGKYFRAALDATAFYPEGGGQPADHGSLGCARVLDVHEQDGVIWHTLTTPVRVGETVQGDLDWQRRFSLMQQHTGEHIVSGIVHTLYGYDNVGFHISDDCVTVDFNGVLDEEALRTVEYAANAIIWSDAPVRAEFPLEQQLRTMEYRSKKELTGAVRIVTAGDADVCACCGTHVERCGQVGSIRLLGAQSYKGGVRVTMACGDRAMKDSVEKHAAVSAISALLSAKPAEVADAVRRVLDENTALKARAAQLENELFAARAAEYAGRSKAVCFTDGLSADSVRRFCLALCDACADGAVCAVFSKTADGFSYALAQENGDVRPLCKKMNETLMGRGGGKPMLCQGSVTCREDSIAAFFEAV